MTLHTKARAGAIRPARYHLAVARARWTVACALALAAVLPTLAWSATPGKFAGTYRIEDWQALARQGVHQFFYLHPQGVFVLAAEWPGNETSRFVGTWSVTGDRLYLNGQGTVDTNQGNWDTEYHRTFRIRVQPGGFRLEPVPEKNRYGLMGWPNAFEFYRLQPEPNLPSGELPSNADALLAWIERRLGEGGTGGQG